MCVSAWTATVSFLAVRLLNEWAQVRLFLELINLALEPGDVSLLSRMPKDGL